jgi:hypothetical protein
MSCSQWRVPLAHCPKSTAGGRHGSRHDGFRHRGRGGGRAVAGPDAERVHVLSTPLPLHDNAYTEEGQEVHRRVDRFDHVLPDPVPTPAGGGEEDEEPPNIARSVILGSERLGLTGKLDLVSTAGDEAVPVDTKRGRVPQNAERSWEPERVQLMAQGCCCGSMAIAPITASSTSPRRARV